MDLEKRSPTPPAEAPPRTATPHLRASDADRERAAEVLADALATGRIDPQEHSERLDRVYAAKTLAEIEPQLADLPDPGTSLTEAPARPSPGAIPESADDTLYGIFSDVVRRGRWSPGRRTHAYAVFGDVVVDLSEAVFQHRQIVVKGFALFGNVKVRVPENVSLRGRGTAVFGTFEVDTLASAERDAPVVFVEGLAVFGDLTARPRHGKLIRDLRGLLRKRLQG
ncbi:hypothetical protein C9F11_26240 [Streptomyces sp. YIM 121038]|uniref:DUF1707 SHOCT-like domain-containing protein n=1 Tax=Streptomyces sp. YIM 121038 TaxID=2136401 RepID=UPI0011109E7C|nr:DUF1707 domain-containing protein [Streptomyces sp. YIM 121038]QCX78858.1 hypothetical protein C9F11_26240 [Streptomyces sp. YIM 121038]